jgi:RNA polymerase sigma-70 factor (ECF subfamily)
MQDGSATAEVLLIEKAIGGDQAAFGELVRRHEATVARTVFSMLGQCAEAEDVGQEVMVRLYRSLAGFRGEASLKTYVTRIAMNLSIDALRRRRRRAWQFWRGEDDSETEIADPRDTAGGVEVRQSVSKALAALGEEFRSVVVLRLIHGYSTGETADMLDIPEGTVLSRLARAKKKLTEQLEGMHQ